MNIVGIAAEFNPFHLGHAHFLREVRKKAGDSAVLCCVLSGDFVQRGEPALFSKFARARAAVACGADLVLELPLPRSLASAEGFGDGAVAVLAGLGGVRQIAFGMEESTCRPLQEIAAYLLTEEFERKLRLRLGGPRSYAAAREEVVAERFPAYREILSRPNNILAIEYLKAMQRRKESWEVLAVPRSGAGHDEPEGRGIIRSGAEIRALCLRGGDWSSFVPAPACRIFEAEMSSGRGPVSMQGMEKPLLAVLRSQPPEAYAASPGGAGGVGMALSKAVRRERSLQAILSAAKSKKYPLSRVRRTLMQTALHLREEDARAEIPYLRVLACSGAGQNALAALRGKGRIPVLTKPAEVYRMGDPGAVRIFQLGSDAHDLYALAYDGLPEPGGDFRMHPWILEGGEKAGEE